MTWPRRHIVLVVSDADADEQSRVRKLQLNVERLGSDTYKLIVDTVELAHSLSAEDWHRRVERVRWHIRRAARRLWADIWPQATLQAARDHFLSDLLAAGWSPDKTARAVGLRRKLTKAVRERLAQINVGAAKPSVGVELVGQGDCVEAPRHAFVQV
jgi:sugar diacid utilization regulator